MDPFERRVDSTGLAVLIARTLESRGVLAAFTERTGGASPEPFDSLNLGFKEGDDAPIVRSNRARVVSALGIGPFAFSEQVHGSGVARLAPGAPAVGFDDPDSAAPGCDALVATGAGPPVAVLTADCVPIALADGDRMAAVHAGWRGLASGVVARGIDAFRDPFRVAAAIGPAIGPCHYEVGEEVLSQIEAGAGISPRAERRGGSWWLDLPGSVNDALRASGVREVAEGSPCTACEPERFFSYRRDGRTGRQALVVARP